MKRAETTRVEPMARRLAGLLPLCSHDHGQRLLDLRWYPFAPPKL